MFPDGFYEELENAAWRGTVAGGVQAMRYFRNGAGDGERHSTLAELDVTQAVLTTIHPYLSNVARRYDLGLAYFAEDLDQSDDRTERGRLTRQMLDQLRDTRKLVCTNESCFAEAAEDSIAVLLDPIDGTHNFDIELPLFVCALAIFVRGRLHCGAIYNPIPSVVFYGSLRDEDGSRGNATAWRVQTGERTELTSVDLGPKGGGGPLAVHLTRSNPAKRDAFLGMLGPLASRFSGTFMLNSGQLALAYVANAHVSAYVNNYTRTWDVAAGDVLVRAVGGKVTDFRGMPIDYWGATRIEVIASRTDQAHQIIQDLTRDAIAPSGRVRRALEPVPTGEAAFFTQA
jgi:fructose-1,6-bisphosphatase/inositol monophosphatase family enzyme